MESSDIPGQTLVVEWYGGVPPTTQPARATYVCWAMQSLESFVRKERLTSTAANVLPWDFMIR